MPYKSDAQRRFAHTATARKQGWSAKSVDEYDRTSKGLKLPERSEKSPKERAMHGLRRAAGMGRGKR